VIYVSQDRGSSTPEAETEYNPQIAVPALFKYMESFRVSHRLLRRVSHESVRIVIIKQIIEALGIP
jgi:hypothetical protein